MVQSGVRGIDPIDTVKTQVVGVDGTRPDLVCFDETGQERVLIEVKFWAGLTANQPSGYIKRLPQDSPAVVMFLVPDDRVRYLWPQLRERLHREFGLVEELDAERRCVSISGSRRHLMVVSWEGLLDAMAARSSDSGEPRAVTQIRQLRSLARYADECAFKPIPQATSPASTSEIRLRQYRRLVDAATEEGINQDWADRKGLRATPKPYGYGRYIRLHGNVVWFGINTRTVRDHRQDPSLGLSLGRQGRRTRRERRTRQQGPRLVPFAWPALVPDRPQKRRRVPPGTRRRRRQPQTLQRRPPNSPKSRRTSCQLTHNGIGADSRALRGVSL